MNFKSGLIIAFVFLGLFIISTSYSHAQVVINEFLPNSATEWVEFYNSSSSAEFLKNYYVDDDLDFTNDVGSKIKQLTELDITNITYPLINFSSFLNNSGDTIALFDPNGALIDKYEYNSDPGKEISLGRYPDQSGSFGILISLTKGLANTAIQTASPEPIKTNSPTSVPVTPIPTSVKTPSATVTSTRIPTSKPTVSPKPSVFKTATEKKVDDLGITDVSSTVDINNVLGLASVASDSPERSNNKNRLPAIFIIIAGIILIAVALIYAYKTAKSSQDLK